MGDAYRRAGVDVAAADRLVNRIAGTVTATWGNTALGAFGGFAGAFRIPPDFENPVLLVSTDGVGTKLDIARRTGNVSGVGHDLVAMCVDDLAAAGARPLAFTDYLAVGTLTPDRDAAIIESVADACRIAGCALVGGETAEHPGTMAPDTFDLAGTAVGVAEEDRLVTGAGIVAGDTILGVHSPNLRSNGFSLVRAVFGDVDLASAFPGDSRTYADVLLEPSVVYAPAILDAVTTGTVKGLAHITGGGLIANVPRALAANTAAVIDGTAWPVPHVFDVLADHGDLARSGMYSVFNMGIGFVVISAPEHAGRIVEAISRHGHTVWTIGEVTSGNGLATVEL